MNLFHWLSGQDVLSSGGTMNSPRDMLWSWITITLSGAIIAGYSVIAFNWYFQSKLARHAEAANALRRLRNISVACAGCGVTFFLLDIPFFVWRLYDAVLVLLVIYTWGFLLKMRGLSLIDERLAQLNELEKSARKYQEIAELLPHIVWTATADGHIDFSNQSWRDYAGGRVEQQTWLDVVHPDQRDHANQRWRESLEAQQSLALELRLRCATGCYRTFLVRAAPIRQGEAIKWLGACADIEDQKLLAVQQEMQARQKSFFLNALSHDLRAPLHNVLLNAQLLSMTARDEADAESVRMIVENAVAAGDLITQLLEFAKAGAQQRPGPADYNVVEPVYVHAILRQVVRRFLPSAESKGLSLRVEGDSDVNVTIRTDRQKLERILSNLVDNAIKYTDAGGVALSMRTICNDPVTADRQIAVSVTDTGRGIPAENIPYLFDEFYQVNNYERDRSKGFGMGLAICRQLARHLGGDVRLASSSPQGSCFELLLKSLCPDRGGRPGGAQGDHAHSQAAGVCRV